MGWGVPPQVGVRSIFEVSDVRFTKLEMAVNKPTEGYRRYPGLSMHDERTCQSKHQNGAAAVVDACFP